MINNPDVNSGDPPRQQSRHHAVKQLTGVHHCLIPAYNQSTCTANLKIEVW